MEEAPRERRRHRFRRAQTGATVWTTLRTDHGSRYPRPVSDAHTRGAPRSREPTAESPHTRTIPLTETPTWPARREISNPYTPREVPGYVSDRRLFLAATPPPRSSRGVLPAIFAPSLALQLWQRVLPPRPIWCSEGPLGGPVLSLFGESFQGYAASTHDSADPRADTVQGTKYPVRPRRQACRAHDRQAGAHER